MEILSSTDVIGEEIKEEARKKADLILKNADAEIKRLQAKMKEKIAKLQNSQAHLYDAKIQKYREDVFVRLPLKKFKEKIEYVERLFSSASDRYFASLDINSKLFILKTLLKKYRPVLQQKRIIVGYAGFPKDKVIRLLASVLPNCRVEDLKEVKLPCVRRSFCCEGIFIEDVEHTFVCKASIEVAKNALFEQKKCELCDVLFEDDKET